MDAMPGASASYEEVRPELSADRWARDTYPKRFGAAAVSIRADRRAR